MVDTQLAASDIAPTVRPETGRGSRLRAWGAQHGLTTVLVLALSFLVLYPLGRLQFLALENGGSSYVKALAIPDIAKTLLTTVALGLGSFVIATVLGTVLAWFALRLPRRASWLSVIPILPMVLPAVAVVVGWAFLLSPQVGFINSALRLLPFVEVHTPKVGMPSGPLDIYTVQGIVLVTGLQMVPLVYLFVQSSLRQLNFESIEAASVAGAGAFRAFISIVLPLLRPGLIYAGAFAILIGLGQLTAPQFLGTKSGVRVLATEVYKFGGETPTDFGVAAAVGSPLLIAGIGFILLQRLLLRRNFRFASAGSRGARKAMKSSRWSVPLISAYGLIALVLPFGAILIVSLTPFWSGQINPAAFSFRNFEAVLADPKVLDAIWTSIGTSIGAILIALPLGYLLADVLYRGRGNAGVRWILDMIVQIPLGVPAVIFGVGFLFVYLGRPFSLYGTPLLMVLTYVVIVLPFTTRMQLTARMAVGYAFEDAARAAGANVVRAHLDVMVPMLRGALGGASVLMFVILTHEFAASLFIRSPRIQVMGTLLYNEWATGTFPRTAAVAIVISLVTAVGLVLAVRIGGRESTLDRL